MEIKKIVRAIPALMIMACSFYLSSKEHIDEMPGFVMADKVVHFVCFGGLAFAVAFAVDIRELRKVYLPALIVSVYGIVDEIHQSMVPGRECSAGDWVADTIGAIAGAIAYVVVAKIVLKKLGARETVR